MYMENKINMWQIFLMSVRYNALFLHESGWRNSMEMLRKAYFILFQHMLLMYRYWCMGFINN